MTREDKQNIKRAITRQIAKALPSTMPGMRAGTQFQVRHESRDTHVVIKAVDILEGGVTYFHVTVKEMRL